MCCARSVLGAVQDPGVPQARPSCWGRSRTLASRQQRCSREERWLGLELQCWEAVSSPPPERDPPRHPCELARWGCPGSPRALGGKGRTAARDFWPGPCPLLEAPRTAQPLCWQKCLSGWKGSGPRRSLLAFRCSSSTKQASFPALKF